MGYAIFAARKLMLTNRVNNLNFRIMCLSQQQQSLADISGRMQQYFGMLSTNASNDMMQQMMAMQSGQQFNSGAMGAFGNLLGMGGNMMAGMYNQQQQISAMSQLMLKPVADAENQIECERKRLETQLAAAQKELEKVEQAEEKAIERSAPKYA